MPFLPPEVLGDEVSIRLAAERAIALAKSGESRAALALALHARRNARLMELQQGEGEALNAAAIVHLIRGDAVAAVATAIDACDLARRTGDAVLRGHATVSLYMSACTLGACEDALEHLERLADEAAAHGSHAVEVRARLAIGVIHGDRTEFDAAELQFVGALKLAREHPGPTGPSRITANIANLHRKRAALCFAQGFEAKALHDCAEAIRLAQHACVLATHESAVATEIDALGIIGCVHEMRGERQRARSYFKESIALGHWARCPSSILWVLCESGRMCLELGEPQGASEAFAEALRIATDLRPSRKIALACAGLAEVASRRGEVAEASAWRERQSAETVAFDLASNQTRRQLRDFLAIAR